MPRLPNHAFRYCLLVRFTACTRALHTVPIPVVQRNQAHGGQALIPGVQASDTGQVNEALGSQDEEETSDKSSLFQAPSNKSKANASLLQRANRSRTRRPPAAAAAAGAGVLAPELAAEDFGAGRAAEAKVNTILEAAPSLESVPAG
eukprot:CAMPEP_0168447038 /NCGR_PEP_ID=MMETSP0228-20121227/46386_1 /TAXON_ID=133427 /ORGANISM="Protoceratium reticulatum, Strain CCCM 535 (=CCMP 1889)" /LENGTH=146 /DNA_ID=CAMNT_0008461555 /DNA_START=40 /DNA_END=477 /DNA_ORIENTATION=-